MSSDKSEEPTPRRLRKAREQGDVPVSAVLSQGGAFIVALVILPTAVAHLAHAFIHDTQLAILGESGSAWQWALRVLWVTLPLLASVAAAAALIS